MGRGTVLGPVDRNGGAVRRRSTLMLLSHACWEVRTWQWNWQSCAFFLGEISFAILSHLGWALGRSFDLQGLLQARSKGLALGHAVPQAFSGQGKDRPCTSPLLTQLSTSRWCSSNMVILKFNFHCWLCWLNITTAEEAESLQQRMISG